MRAIEKVAGRNHHRNGPPVNHELRTTNGYLNYTTTTFCNQEKTRTINLRTTNMEAQVINKINYQTNQLKKSFRLNSHDTEDVRQDLTLKALEAERAYNPESAASLTTFVKIAVENKAADIFCKLKIQPIMDNREKCGGIEGAGVRNHNFQRTAEIMDELNDVNHAPATETKKIKIKPTVSSIGVNLQHITEAKPENTPEVKMDVQAVLATLTPRQRKICKMITAGNTQKEIAKSLKISQRHVGRLIEQLRVSFSFLRKQQKKDV